ncbi:MAG: AraC family transcriptional regulator [Gammaproteobacteria bacterium]|nr:AraC family transcriptional regulator [Gammaproteobacteria bacterium]
MRSVTAESHHRRLVRALEYIAGNPERPCTVEEVAAAAAFSRFHCQRMFLAMTGESIADLVRRLRLERAAWRLRQEPVDVTEAALDAGYSSAEAFSRAFRRGFGMSPSRYRTAWPPPRFGSQALRVRYYPGEGRIEIDPPSGESNMDIRIESLGEIKLARIRHVGPYNEVGQHFERLFEWAGRVGARPGRVLCLSYDDPDTVAPENLRSDACLEVDTDTAPPPGITVETLPAGRYAIYTHRGSYDGIPEAFRRLFELWLPQSGEEVDDRPCMEVFHNSPLDTRPDELLTDLCLPLRDDPAEATGK